MKKAKKIYTNIALIICIAIILSAVLPDYLYGQIVEYRCWSEEVNDTLNDIDSSENKKIIAACIKEDYRMINGTKVKYYEQVSCGARMPANESYDLIECLDLVIESKKCRSVDILERKDDYIYAMMRCKR